MGDKIKFSGTVDEGSIGLVTIVIRDQNNEFVLLTQSPINHDDTFENIVNIENKFTQNATYNATGFILNMTKGVTSEFNISLNDNQMDDTVIADETKNEIIHNEQNKEVEIQETSNEDKKTNVINRDFVDPKKPPSYYIERYYSEPEYKSWFDRNYPGQTIEETVGYTDGEDKVKSTVQDIMGKEIIPEAQASSIIELSENNIDNSEIAQTTLVFAALGILFGAVYGVKRQADSNSRQIQINRNSIKIPKIGNPITSSNPKEILQKRLVRGEITLEEYNQLEKKLD
jgi:hypothetical protein